MILISYYEGNLDWIKSLKKNNIIIYNKSKKKQLNLNIKNIKVINKKNFGGNQCDLIHFIINNYKSLPDKICNLQDDPFDHIGTNKLLNFIEKKFSSIESFDKKYHNKWTKGPISMLKNSFSFKINNDIDHGYSELNSSWYIDSRNKIVQEQLGYITCEIQSFNEFMNHLFYDYESLKYIRFTPGSQFVLSKEKIQNYSLNFWKKLYNFFPRESINGGTEAHIVERAMYLIFLGIYNERKIITLPRPKKIKNFKAKSQISKKINFIKCMLR